MSLEPGSPPHPARRHLCSPSFADRPLPDLLRLRVVPSLFLFACASPPAPAFPEDLGPPAPAARDCPPVVQFAQHDFLFADLDLGKSCTAFLEQDECILALFEDCTDGNPRVRRSWQGSIDSAEQITVQASRNAPVVAPRSPDKCTGPLQIMTGEPPWSLLKCTLQGHEPETGAHRGLYFEKIAEPRAFGRIGAPITVFVPAAAGAGSFVSDLLVLGRLRGGEIWATVKAGPTSPSSGLYIGGAGSTALARTDAPIGGPTAVRATAEEDIVLVADGVTLYQFRTSSKTLIGSIELDGEILDVAIAGREVVLATRVPAEPPATHLTRRSIDSLDPIPGSDRTIAGLVTGIAPISKTASTASTLLVLAEARHLLVVDRAFAEEQRIDLEDSPATYAILAGGRIALAFARSGLYEEIDLATGTRSSVMTVPEGADVRAMLYRPGPPLGRILVGAQDGLLTPIDEQAHRPLLQSRLTSGGAITRLALDTNTGTVYALDGDAGVVSPIVPL